MIRPSREEQLMLQAMIASLRSTCGRRKVGAVIASGGRPLSAGYAGPPSGFPHCDAACLASSSGGCSRTIHAEQNAIAYAARKGVSVEGAELYCTLSPCKECAKLIINSGIVSVYYWEEYRDPSGVQLLKESGISCQIQNVRPAIFTGLLQMYAFGVNNRGDQDVMSWLSEMPPLP